MTIGELIFVGEGKTKLTTVQNITSDGVTVEFTWEGEVKGTGKAEGVNGGIVFTGRKIAPFSGLGKGTTSGQGILFTGKDMVAIKSSGYGNPRWKENKSVEIWSFMTVSQKLNWINDEVTLVTQEGDPAWKEFKISIKEWK